MPTTDELLTGLSTRLDSLLSRKPRDGDDDPDGDGEDLRSVPALKAELKRVRALRRQETETHSNDFAGLKKQLEEIKTSTAAALADVGKRHKDEVATLTTEHGHALSLARAGITDDRHARAVRAAWGEMDPAKRPATPGEYWSEVVKTSSKKDGLKDIPRELHGYIPAPTTTRKEAPNTAEGTSGSTLSAMERIKSAKSKKELDEIAAELDRARQVG